MVSTGRGLALGSRTPGFQWLMPSAYLTKCPGTLRSSGSPCSVLALGPQLCRVAVAAWLPQLQLSHSWTTMPTQDTLRYAVFKSEITAPAPSKFSTYFLLAYFFFFFFLDFYRPLFKEICLVTVTIWLLQAGPFCIISKRQYCRHC